MQLLWLRCQENMIGKTARLCSHFSNNAALRQALDRALSAGEHAAVGHRAVDDRLAELEVALSLLLKRGTQFVLQFPNVFWRRRLRCRRLNNNRLRRGVRYNPLLR